MITYREFSAWITCEGKEIVEYEIAVDANMHRVSCWIPSQDGKPFVVHWRDHGSQIETATYINLDGHVAPGQFLFGEGDARRSGIRNADNTERPFVFQKVEEPDVGPRSKSIETTSKSKDIGTILVRIKRIKTTRPRPANMPQQPPAVVRGRRNVGDPCIGYGEEKATHNRFETTWDFKPHDKHNPGSYVFAFRYRSRDFLISQDIMSPDDPETREAPLPKRAHLPPLPVATPPIIRSPVVTTPSSTGSPVIMTPIPTPPRTQDRIISLGKVPYGGGTYPDLSVAAMSPLTMSPRTMSPSTTSPNVMSLNAMTSSAISPNAIGLSAMSPSAMNPSAMSPTTHQPEDTEAFNWFRANVTRNGWN